MPTFHLGFPSPSIADLSMPDHVALARKIEDLGFDTLWHSNERFYREMFIRMASSAMVTSRITLGGAIVEPFAVHPALTAQSLGTLDELSGGRATVAIGAGGSGFQMMGINRKHSAQAVREAYTVMRGLLAGEEVTLAGKLIQANQARLQFVPAHPIPLWIATRGDLTLETSGEYAEAVMIATYASPGGIAEAKKLVETGAQRAGRSIDQIRMLSRVDTCVHQDVKTAYDGTRLMIARFLWGSYPDRNFVHRVGLDVPPDVEALIACRDHSLVPQIAALIPDEFVSAFCWAGTPEMVAERVVAVARLTGIREFGFWLLMAPGQTREEAVQLLAEEVLPLIRSELG
ncbi:MAG: LLM class flavin-dependent oxidoreductase [Chloroflexi bacterium]|nr:LLM class flavin-dependent oxidoreductase [Chloroflexota bacterium]